MLNICLIEFAFKLVLYLCSSHVCESKRSKRLGFVTFFYNSVINLTTADHSSILVVSSLVTTATRVKIEVSKVTVIFIPSII